MALDLHGLAPLLQVFDMPTSIRFYCGVLGFELVTTSRPGEGFGWGLLRLHGATLMLNTAYEEDARPAAPDPARVVAHGDTTLFFDCPDLDLAYGQLAAQGVTVPEPVVRTYGMRQLSVKDPDGYALCFQHPVR